MEIDVSGGPYASRRVGEVMSRGRVPRKRGTPVQSKRGAKSSRMVTREALRLQVERIPAIDRAGWGCRAPLHPAVDRYANLGIRKFPCAAPEPADRLRVCA